VLPVEVRTKTTLLLETELLEYPSRRNVARVDERLDTCRHVFI